MRRARGQKDVDTSDRYVHQGLVLEPRNRRHLMRTNDEGVVVSLRATPDGNWSLACSIRAMGPRGSWFEVATATDPEDFEALLRKMTLGNLQYCLERETLEDWQRERLSLRCAQELSEQPDRFRDSIAALTTEQLQGMVVEGVTTDAQRAIAEELTQRGVNVS